MSANGFGGVMDTSRNGLSMPVPEIPGYEILQRIGKGGMGEVYLARQLALDRLVAIKFLLPDGPLDPENDTARFRREAELMAKVSHPNILSIFDFGEADGFHYLIAEFAEGGDLRRRMSPGLPMPLDEVRSIVLPVGEALAHLHRLGIVHRDLKPENILLDEARKPIVSDFGISILRAASETLTRTGRGPGTLGYIAPEQQYGMKVDERADQYSLAALAYEMLTGHLPLGLFKPPSQHNHLVSLEVDRVLLRALQETPRDRFATIEDFTADLDRALAAPRTAPKRPTSKDYGWAALILLIITGAIAAYLTRELLAPIQPPDPPAIAKGAAKPRPAEDPLIRKLKEKRAYEIWVNRGSPEGAAGEAMKDENWFAASESIEKEIGVIAYRIWKESGRPEGAAGEAAMPVNKAKAVRELYRKMTGEDPPGPGSP